MASPLLETKLHVPRPRRLVPRPRLSERLGRGAEARLTLVSAPAGFGKTTLLAEWLAGVAADGPSAAWASLDQGDNHPATFWTYVVAALQRAQPGVGADALARLSAAQPPPIEALLPMLLNELSGIPSDVVLVLDDYRARRGREQHPAAAPGHAAVAPRPDRAAVAEGARAARRHGRRHRHTGRRPPARRGSAALTGARAVAGYGIPDPT